MQAGGETSIHLQDMVRLSIWSPPEMGSEIPGLQPWTLVIPALDLVPHGCLLYNAKETVLEARRAVSSWSELVSLLNSKWGKSQRNPGTYNWTISIQNSSSVKLSQISQRRSPTRPLLTWRSANLFSAWIVHLGQFNKQIPHSSWLS